MHYFLPVLLTLLFSFSATAQDSFADDDKFLGYIGPTSEAQRAQAGQMILEMPTPNTATKFGENGEFVLIYTEFDRFWVSGTNDPAIDDKFYSEHEAVEIFKAHYQHSSPPLQLGVYKDVGSEAMVKMHKFCETIASDITIFIMR